MPKPLGSRSKELVASLLSYFEKERDHGGPLIPINAVRERVAAALNLSMTTVCSISKTVKNGGVLKSPKKKRPHPKPVTGENVKSNSIRDVIYEMYEHKEHVTLLKLHAKLKERHLFLGCAKSLRLVLQQIGFKWMKDNPRRGLMELPDIAFKRIQFLKSYKQLKDESLYQFVFLDETWIFQNGTVGRSWQDTDKRSVKSTKVDGKRYIVLHAGNEEGFIPGAEVVFSSKTNTGDYHGEMNHINFLTWFENQLLKNLMHPSVIVMDNAPYHSTLIEKNPTSAWRKQQIQEWLTKHNIQFHVEMFKNELLHIAAQSKIPKIYMADQLAEQYGHKVLRLPPYHCNFNPIELIWGLTKTYYNKHIGRDGRTMDACLNMWKEALQTATPEVWKSSIKHTEREIKRWWDRERVFDREDVADLIIRLNGDDSDSDFDFD